MPVDQYIGGIEHAILPYYILDFLLKELMHVTKTSIFQNHLKIYLLKVWFVTRHIKISMEPGYILMK